jgi:hypothetical protein
MRTEFVSNADASAAPEQDRTSNFLPEDEKYRLTGVMPVEGDDKSQPVKRDDSAASGKENQPGKDDASAASAADSTRSASETQRTEVRRENRWQKRERELRELREENTRLKSQPSREQQRSEPAQVSQPATETTTAKAAPKPKLDDIDPKTNQPKYRNYAEYEDAKDAWLRQETIREFNETTAKTQRESEQQRAEREIGQTLNKKFEPSRAKYADFDQVALSNKLTIPKGSAAELFILDSDHAGEVLYHLGQHPEILQGFYRDHDPKTGKFTSLITPQRQFRKLMEIEAQFSGAASTAGESSTTSSAKPVTQASRPPHQVSGQGTVSKDAVEQALEDGDFETYSKAQNAKELARLKRK